MCIKYVSIEKEVKKHSRKSCEAREAITVLKILSERNLEYSLNVYVCFVDFEKAFEELDGISYWKF